MGVFCPFCGSDVDPQQAQAGSLPGTVHCPTCRQEIDVPGSPPLMSPPPFAPPPMAPPQITPEPPQPGPAWEGEGGFFSRLVRTTGQVLFHPVRFFRAPARPGYAWALSFGLILGTLGQACNVYWGHVLGNEYLSFRSAILGLIFSPFMVIASVFLTTWVVHFCLWILRGTHNGVQATFRVMAYGQATALFMLIPPNSLGMAIAAVWGLVVAIGGLAAVHGTGRWRAFWALFLPMVFIFGVIIAVVLIMLAVGVGSVFWEQLRGLPGSI